MGLTKSSTPVTSPHRDNTQLGQNDRTPNSGRNLLSTLHTQPNVSIKVTNSNERLKPRPLTSLSLFLDRHNLHHLILQLGEEEIDDLVFLDGEGEEVDFFHRFDFSIFDETSEFGDWLPFFFFVSAASTAGSTASTTLSTTATAESTTSSACVSHRLFV